MNAPTPRASAFAQAREALAAITAAETFWESFEGNPNPPGQNLDVTQVIANAIFAASYDRLVELLTTPATTAGELHEKLVEMRLAALCDDHACWPEVMACLEADAAAIAAIGGDA